MDLKITHNAGFFSCSTVALNQIINFHNTYGYLPKVDRSTQYNLYKDSSVDSIDNFFKEKEIEININPSFLVNTDIEDQFSDYSLINHDYTSKLVNQYFSTSEKVNEIEDYLIRKYNISFDKTICVLYRGTDKISETTLPTYGEFLEKINNLRELNPEHVVLLQTDELEFSEYILSNMETISILETKMSRKGGRAVQYTINVGDRLYQAQLFLAIVKIISKCDEVILNIGNVGLWISLYRGTNNGIYQYISNGKKSNLSTNNQEIRWSK
jgi:hypothetical protein